MMYYIDCTSYLCSFIGKICGPSSTTVSHEDETHPLLSSSTTAYRDTEFTKSVAQEIPKLVTNLSVHTLIN